MSLSNLGSPTDALSGIGYGKVAFHLALANQSDIGLCFNVFTNAAYKESSVAFDCASTATYTNIAQ